MWLVIVPVPSGLGMAQEGICSTEQGYFSAWHLVTAMIHSAANKAHSGGDVPMNILILGGTPTEQPPFYTLALQLASFSPLAPDSLSLSLSFTHTHTHTHKHTHTFQHGARGPSSGCEWVEKVASTVPTHLAPLP